MEKVSHDRAKYEDLHRKGKKLRHIQTTRAWWQHFATVIWPVMKPVYIILS